MPQRRSQRSRSTRHYEDSSSDAEEHGDETRCICGHAELQLPKKQDSPDEIDAGLFIQCDSCHVWQHGYCVGFSSEKDVPDVYYCEKCHPELHLVVLRPSGKTSSYIPHLKKLGIYPLNDKQGEDQEGEKEEEEDGDSFGEEPAEQYDERDESPKQESLPAAAKDDGTGNGTVNNNGNGITRRKNKNKSSAISTREQRRRTQNSSRQLEYEETLRRVLEESVHDAKTGGEDQFSGDEELSDDIDESHHKTDTHEPKRRGSTSRRNTSSEKEEQASAVFNADGNDASVSRKRKPTRGSRPATPRLSGNEEISHDDSHNEEVDDAQEGFSSANATASGSTGRKRTKRKTPVKDKTKSSIKLGKKTTVSPSPKDSDASNILSAESKPRIPQPRSTVAEMQKRVAAILEFIGRTQVDMADEQEERQGLLKDRTEIYHDSVKNLKEEKYRAEFDSAASLQSLDQLTKKLLIWEQTFGRYRRPE